MASAVYSEPPSSRLSISLEGTASASPFPSPSSSFLPPPTPGAHEFAVKPVPPARNGRKTSNGNATSHPQPQPQPQPQLAPAPSPPLLLPETDSVNGDLGVSHASELKMQHEPSSQPLVAQAQISNINGLSQQPPASKESLPPVPLSPALISPMTPTPSSIQRKIIPREYLEPPRSPGHLDQSHSSSTTPTIPTAALPPEDDEQMITDNSTATATSSSLSSSSLSPPPSHGQGAESSLSKIIIPDGFIEASTPGSGFSSPAFTPSSRPISTADPSLFSNRPAPPSPASRRVSGAPSMSSNRSRSSRPPSTAVSRTNSLRKSTNSTHSGAVSARNSPVINPHRQSVGSQLSQSFAPLPSPQNLTFSLNVQQPSASGSSSSSINPAGGAPASPTTPATATLLPSTATPSSSNSKRGSAIIYIKIRDFGFAPSDERHIGLGPEVPKPNHIGRMNRRLRGTRTLSTFSQSSVSSSDGDGDEEEEEEDIEDWSIGGYGLGRGMGGGGAGGWDGFRMGLGRFNWNTGANAATVMENERLQAQNQDFPSRMDLDRNFLDGDSEPELDDEDEYYDAVHEEEDLGEEEEETLYPGLYRALYAFEPEGTAEMRLVEDQIVRVVGRGGGVGWAVVIDESGGGEADAGADETTTASTGEGEGGDKTKTNGRPPAAPKHALVPESYLEPVRLDWEDEGAAVHPAAADVMTPVGAVPSITLA